MCGITGFIDFTKQSSKEELIRMSTSLAHRGPDGDGNELIEEPMAQIGLGHRRLAVLDLSDQGKQPMRFEHLWIILNGEIYNFNELKTELINLGHRFSGTSDTEMILHAYLEWGDSCIERFIGMFTIVIYDRKHERVFCVRDRAGVKPFFYYWKDGLFLFASELKAFHEHERFEKEIDPSAVAAFMQYGNVPTPHCIFKHCKKLLPGHSLSISLSDKTVSLNKYWDVYDAYNQPKLTLPYAEAQKETEKILQSSFEYRMVSDVPVGVFLSGGFDSVCVTSLLQKDRTEKLRTYTIGVPDIGLNEAPCAKEIANYLGTDHTEFNCTEKEVLEIIEHLPFNFDEPFADSSAIPTTLVSKMARKDVTVALSADAGDEIFAGYNRYDYMQRYGDKLSKIPGFVRRMTVGTMEKVPSNWLPFLKNKYNFHNRYEKLKMVLRDPSDHTIMLSLSQQFTDAQMRQMMKTDYEVLQTAYENDSLDRTTNSTLNYMMAVDFQTYLVDDILQKVDRSTMTVSLEGREPFLDQRIIEFAARLPDEYKYHNGVKKRILRDIVHQYVPKEMMDRPKMGFAIPIANWMTHELRPLVEEFVSEKNIREQGLLNWEEVAKLKKAFFSGKKEYDFKIWYLLMFQMWYAKWM